MTNERATFSATVHLTEALLRTADGREVIIQGVDAVGDTGLVVAGRLNPISLMELFQTQFGPGKENIIGRADDQTLARAARNGSADFIFKGSFNFENSVSDAHPTDGGGHVVFAKITAIVTVRRELDG